MDESTDEEGLKRRMESVDRAKEFSSYPVDVYTLRAKDLTSIFIWRPLILSALVLVINWSSCRIDWFIVAGVLGGMWVGLLMTRQEVKKRGKGEQENG